MRIVVIGAYELLVATVAIALAGCDQGAAAPVHALTSDDPVKSVPFGAAMYPAARLKESEPTGFEHRHRWDESYRLPRSELRIGEYVLRDVHIGSSDDFDHFEANGYKGVAPIALEFDRAGDAEPIIYPEDTARPAALVVRPSAYQVGEHWNALPALRGASYALVANDPILGEVRFEADEYIGPSGGRRLNHFVAGGFEGITLKAVVSAAGAVHHLDLGYLDWWPCPNSGRRQLSLECSRE